MRFKDWKIGARLALGFGVVLLLLLLQAGISLARLQDANARLKQISDVNNAGIEHVDALTAGAAERAVIVRNIVLLTDAAQIATEAARLKTEDAAFKARIGKLQLLFQRYGMNDTEKGLMDVIVRENDATEAPVSKAVALGLASKSGDATLVLMKEVRPPQERLKEALADLAKEERRLNTELVAQAVSAYDSARALLGALCAGATALGALLAWAVTRSVTRPLREAVTVAEAVAGGDLTTQVQVHSKDETGQLLRALGNMNDALVRVVGTVRVGTDAIATASGQIASGNQDLSQRTEEQASSLEETAASMEELTGTVKQNAENARQANQLAQTAAEVAGEGGTVVAQVVDTMASINSASSKMADIISVIDGIAFQTNILALNAAVEAARAGEQGRGFAVVAAEVRSLAQRSAAAAKEIKGLIDDSGAKVHSGSELVARAGATMGEIVASVKRVTDIMGEIAAASQEQSRGIDQVNTAIAQMDQVTQQNAALVEEASAAAQAMQQQAANLVEAVHIFRMAADVEATQVIAQARATVTAPTRAAGAAAVARPKALPQRLQPPAPKALPNAKPATPRRDADNDVDWQEF